MKTHKIILRDGWDDFDDDDNGGGKPEMQIMKTAAGLLEYRNKARENYKIIILLCTGFELHWFWFFISGPCFLPL